MDILKVLKVGAIAPINRQDYWGETYSQQLGKPGVDYWEWKNPEREDICDELQTLYTLTPPNRYAKQVLMVLANNVNPFDKSENNNHPFYQIFLANKYAFYLKSEEERAKLLYEFKIWHEYCYWELTDGAEEQGHKDMVAMYKVVFGCDWAVIEDIVDDIKENSPWWSVLNVSIHAPHHQVKENYLNLVKKYHPDRNNHHRAHHKTQIINRAWEQYKQINSIAS